MSKYDRVESWALSEIKDTFIVTYQKYMEARSEFSRAIHHMGNIEISKSNFVTALDALYQNAQAVFDDYVLKDSGQYIKTKAENLKIQEYSDNDDLLNKYQSLIWNGTSLKEVTLIFMGEIIVEWYMKLGYFRLLNETKQYSNYENEIDDDEGYL